MKIEYKLHAPTPASNTTGREGEQESDSSGRQEREWKMAPSRPGSVNDGPPANRRLHWWVRDLGQGELEIARFYLF